VEVGSASRAKILSERIESEPGGQDESEAADDGDGGGGGSGRQCHDSEVGLVLGTLCRRRRKEEEE